MSDIVTDGFECEDCGHEHTGAKYAYICIGCPCEKRGQKIDMTEAAKKMVGGNPDGWTSVTIQRIAPDEK